MSPWTQRLIDDVVSADPWLSANYRRGRANICRALRIDATDPAARYATAPFVIIDIEGEAWIGGAVGLRIFDAGAHSDIILWHPQSGRLRVHGEAASASILIVPAATGEVTVYADGFSFFRGWADRRAAYITRRRNTAPHDCPPTEPTDGGLPGALALGDLEKLPWMTLGATVLLAGPGIDERRLRRAVTRNANIPRIGSDLRRAA